MTEWDLNPIVLAHVNRFFGAARRVADELGDDAEMTRFATFTANMVWARSNFSDEFPLREQARATLGAAGASMADGIDFGGGRIRESAHAALAELEATLLGNLDGLLTTLLAELQAAGLDQAGPGAVDAWVWQRLFPGYPWAAGQVALETAVRERLGGH